MIRALHGEALAGATVRLETQLLRRDGYRRELELRGVPILHRGQPHVLYISRDITQAKLAERAQRDSEEQYRAIFDASADALVLRDANYRAVGVNPAYLSMSGYTREEVMAASVLTLGDPAVRNRLRADHRLALAGKELRFEISATRKDGSVLQAEVQGTPMTYRGQPHVLYAVRDITARVAAEHRRVELERQLRQAQKMEAIGQLTSGLAHDFNNILTSVLGYIDLAQDRPASALDPVLVRDWRRPGWRPSVRASMWRSCWRSPGPAAASAGCWHRRSDGRGAAAAATEPALLDRRRQRCRRPRSAAVPPGAGRPGAVRAGAAEPVPTPATRSASTAPSACGSSMHRPGVTAPPAACGWMAGAGSASRWPTTAAA